MVNIEQKTWKHEVNENQISKTIENWISLYFDG